MSQLARFELRLTAIDQPTDRLRWNGKPMASDEAHEALFAAVEAFQAVLRERGFQAVHTGYGVTAHERDAGLVA